MADALTPLSNPEHIGFKVLAVLPALAEQAFGGNDAFPALFFSVFDVGTILIVWLLALRLGAGSDEALWAALITATSSSLFYYSPFLLPYGPGLCLGLFGVYLAVSPRERWLTSLATGLVMSGTFIVYNGYWTVALFVGLLHLSCRRVANQVRARRALLLVLGALIPFVAMCAVDVLLDRKPLMLGYLRFSGTVVQGDFNEGGVLPFAYLWAAEGASLPLWSILVACSIPALVRRRPRRLIIALAGLGFLYGCLITTSALLNKFVVYGRLTRPLVPFIALAGAYGASVVVRGLPWKRVGTTALAALLILLAARNVRRPFHLTYPRDFIKQAKRLHGDLQMPERAPSYLAPDVIAAGRFRMHYVKYIYPCPMRSGRVHGKILMRADHPQTYHPFLFEGYGRAEREAFAATDFSMLLEEVGSP